MPSRRLLRGLRGGAHEPCEVQHEQCPALDRGSPKHKYWLSRGCIESSPQGKDLVALVVRKLDMSWAYNPEILAHSVLHQKQRDQQIEGADPPPLLCKTPPGVLHLGSGGQPEQEGHLLGKLQRNP